MLSSPCSLGASLQLAPSVAGRSPAAGCWSLAVLGQQLKQELASQFSFSINAWGLRPAPPFLLVLGAQASACGSDRAWQSPAPTSPAPSTGI